MLEAAKETKHVRTGYIPVRWNYTILAPLERVDLFNSQQRALLLADLMGHIKATLAEFSEAKHFSVYTDSPDDASFEVKLPTESDWAILDNYLKSTLDVSDMDLSFNLNCLKRKHKTDPTSFEEEWDGWIFVFNSIKPDGTLDSKDSSHSPIRVSFQMHNVIYSPNVLSDEYLRDVELNATMLSAFVRRLETFPYLKLRNVECEDFYDGWLQRYGLIKDNQFKLPAA